MYAKEKEKDRVEMGRLEFHAVRNATATRCVRD